MCYSGNILYYTVYIRKGSFLLKSEKGKFVKAKHNKISKIHKLKSSNNK